MDFILALSALFRSCAQQRSFCELAREKVKAYMNFSSPEKIFKLNLWSQLGSLFNFSHLLSAEFYQCGLFEHKTCEKLSSKTRAFSGFYSCALGAVPELRSATQLFR